MRILYFSRDYCPHDHRFLTALADSEHQVFYLRLERGSRQTESRPIPDGIKMVDWSGGKREVQILNAPRLLREFRQVIKRVQPDLVHAGPIQSSALLAALSGFHPLLVMSWGFDLMKDVDRGLFWRWATRYTLQKADWFTSDCHATYHRALKFGLPQGRHTIFPWGVDLKQFSLGIQKHSPGQGSGFTLFCNRSWEPNYGVDVLARAFVKVARERQDVSLLLLGSGSQADLIKGILSSEDVSDRVEFKGHISYELLPEYYQQADLFISPSHVDGSSVSLMEALASGLPCLVSDIPANKEWVTDGRNGWLFPDGNVESLVEHILFAARNRHVLPKMAVAARQVAEQKANWKVNFLSLLEAYQQTVKQGVGRGG
ncbi:glycosyltransferase family 4 protein [Chloroflexota bacterium]